MDLEAIKKLTFTRRTEEAYIAETKQYGEELLDRFLVPGSKKLYQYPKGTQRKDVSLSFRKTILNINHEVLPFPSIEVFFSINHVSEEEIGWCCLIWDAEGELVDDYFVLE